MDDDEIIISRVSNGFVIRGFRYDQRAIVGREEVAVAATPGDLKDWIGDWASAQVAGPKESA